MRAGLLLLALLAASCAGRLPLRRICPDGWPLKILQDPNCPRGVCGYTCAPDRWRTGTPPSEVADSQHHWQRAAFPPGLRSPFPQSGVPTL